MKKYFFKSEDSEMCYTEDYFQYFMREQRLNEIEVFEALPEIIQDVFWCVKHQTCGEKGNQFIACGKECEFYAPRNGASGCCKHYTNIVYSVGNKIKLTRK